MEEQTDKFVARHTNALTRRGLLAAGGASAAMLAFGQVSGAFAQDTATPAADDSAVEAAPAFWGRSAAGAFAGRRHRLSPFRCAGRVEETETRFGELRLAECFVPGLRRPHAVA